METMIFLYLHDSFLSVDARITIDGKQWNNNDRAMFTLLLFGSSTDNDRKSTVIRCKNCHRDSNPYQTERYSF